MKSYLDLVKISGKVHRKQSLMTRIWKSGRTGFPQ